MQTKPGKPVEIILGHTVEVEEVDTLQLRLKSNPENKFLCNKYMGNLVSIQTKVINKHHMLNSELKEWEKVYFIENNFKSPTVSDTKQSVKASQIGDTTRYTKALLKEYNLTKQ